MNDRAQQLLAAYQAGTAPNQEREDALFESIVHRIVSADADMDELDESAPDESELDESELDEPELDEPEVGGARRRGRRAIVVPVAVATAAIAAGLVLAMSLRGQLVTAVGDAAPSQAPNVETAAPQWWNKVVPRGLFGGSEEPEQAVEEPVLGAESDGAEPTVVPAVVGARPATSSQSSRSGGSPASVGSAPTAATPSPTVNAPRDGWGAPSAPGAANATVPGNAPPATQAGGGLPSAPSAPSKNDDDHDGSSKRGDSKSSKGPSGPRPGGPATGGSDGGPDGPGEPPPTPDDPSPPQPPTPDDPGPPPDDCELEHQACWSTTPGPECDMQLEACHGGDPCQLEFDQCVVETGQPAECEQVKQECYGSPSDPLMCFDDYTACAMDGFEPAPCVETLSVCLQESGGSTPEMCVEFTEHCEQIGQPLSCPDVMAACEMSLDPMSECEANHAACIEGAPPEAIEMCEESFDDCLVGVHGDELPPEEHCFAVYDDCMVDGDPEECDAVFSSCMSF